MVFWTHTMKWAEAHPLSASWVVLGVVQRVILDFFKQTFHLGCGWCLLLCGPLFFTWLETPCNIVKVSLGSELLQHLFAEDLLQGGGRLIERCLLLGVLAWLRIVREELNRLRIAEFSEDVLQIRNPIWMCI